MSGAASMPHGTDGRAHLEAERDRRVARMNKGHDEYFAGFRSERSARLAREDPVQYRQADALWIGLLRQYEANCERLAVLEGRRDQGEDDAGDQAVTGGA